MARTRSDSRSASSGSSDQGTHTVRTLRPIPTTRYEVPLPEKEEHKLQSTIEANGEELRVVHMPIALRAWGKGKHVLYL